MHRIDTAGSVDGAFVRGNVLTATPPTLFGDEWPNAVQEEIAGVIEAAGIALEKGSNNQLLAALSYLAGQHATQLAEVKWYTHKPAENTFYKLPNGQGLSTVTYSTLVTALTGVAGNPWLAANEAAKIANPSLWWIDAANSLIYLPDLRGQFARIDPADMSAGGVARPALAQRKANQNKVHSHGVDQYSGGINTVYGSEPFEENGAGGGNQTANSGGDEAVPDHTSVYALIRVL
jgi:hypothetical protein